MATEKVVSEKRGLEIVSGVVNDNECVITVEGPGILQVQGPEARKLAYNARFKHGFSGAGIEIAGGSWPVDEKGEPAGKAGPDVRYRQQYKLTSMG